MRNLGVVVKFDGYCGMVRDIRNNEYLLLKKDICGDIKNNIMVSFIGEKTKGRLISRFVKRHNV